MATALDAFTAGFDVPALMPIGNAQKYPQALCTAPLSSWEEHR
ncbi:hypothetical protein [Mycolicibacterium brumae]|nr:hypothetical protein [Mycolicibacterium brumae]RWA23424.1 hypothetical protein MBRU_00980 [Mycolicibacterium brumae DSM 44177]